MQYIRLQHEVLEAKFDEEAGKWVLKIRKLRQSAVSNFKDGNQAEDYEVFTDSADMLISGTGYGPLITLWKAPIKTAHSQMLITLGLAGYSGSRVVQGRTQTHCGMGYR